MALTPKTKANISLGALPLPATLIPPSTPAPPERCPMLYISHASANSARIPTATKIHTVDFKRPFITASTPSSVALFEPLGRSIGPRKLDHSNGKSLRQFFQVQSQRQPILMAQHAAAMRHIHRRLLDEQGRGRAVSADDFVGGDPNTQIVAIAFRRQAGHYDVPRRQITAPAFTKRDVHHWNNRTPQIKDAHQKPRTQTPKSQCRPLDDFLNIQHGK